MPENNQHNLTFEDEEDENYNENEETSKQHYDDFWKNQAETINSKINKLAKAKTQRGATIGGGPGQADNIYYQQNSYALY